MGLIVQVVDMRRGFNKMVKINKICECGNVIKEYRPGRRMKYIQCYACRCKTAEQFVTSMERISNSGKGGLL